MEKRSCRLRSLLPLLPLLLLPLACQRGEEGVAPPPPSASPASVGAGDGVGPLPSPSAPEPGKAPAPGALATPEPPPPPADKVFARVEGEPLTYGELERFGEVRLGKMHQARSRNTMEYLKAFVRSRALVKEAERRGLDRQKAVKEELELRQLLILGEAYQNFLGDKVPVDPEKLKGKIPSQWVQARFRLLGFTSPEEAEEARKKLNPPDFTPPAGLKGHVAVANLMDPETQWLWPGSGRFDPFDDPYLFALPKGALSRPVLTPLGPVLAVVTDRKEYTPEEQALFLGELRRDLQGQNRESYLNRQTAPFTPTVDEKAFREAVAAFYTGSGEVPGQAVGRVGSLSIPFDVFLRNGGVNMGPLRRMDDREAVRRLLLDDFSLMARTVALGMAARREGWIPAGGTKEEWAERMEGERQRLLEERASFLIRREASIAIDEPMLKQYYEAVKDKLENKDVIRIRYYFTPNGEDLTRMSERAVQGIPFESLGDGLERKTHSETPFQMKEKRIVRGGKELEHLQSSLFQLKKGETRVLELPTGYYLVNVLDLRPGGVPAFEDVRKFLQGRLEEEQRWTHQEKTLQRLIREIPVTMEGEDAGKQKGTPSPGTPDQG